VLVTPAPLGDTAARRRTGTGAMKVCRHPPAAGDPSPAATPGCGRAVCTHLEMTDMANSPTLLRLGARGLTISCPKHSWSPRERSLITPCTHKNAHVPRHATAPRQAAACSCWWMDARDAVVTTPARTRPGPTWRTASQPSTPGTGRARHPEHSILP
jgi:hypothetical protein